MSLDRDDQIREQFSENGIYTTDYNPHAHLDCDHAALWDYDMCIAGFTRTDDDTFTLTDSDVSAFADDILSETRYASARDALDAAQAWYAVHRS